MLIIIYTEEKPPGSFSLCFCFFFCLLACRCCVSYLLSAVITDDINDYYEIKEKLGTGSFAVVKRCIRKSDGKQFAAKIIKKSKLNAEELAVVHDEVEIMHKISHPHCKHISTYI